MATRGLGLAVALLISLAWMPWQARAGGKTIMVIGDSMSEEYAFEFPFSAPNIPPFEVNTRNWLECLHRWRGQGSGPDWLFFGSYQSTLGYYLDLRNAGHASNFGVPSFTTQHWIDVRYSTSSGNPIYYATRVEIATQAPNVSAAVIFLGGNDLKNDYTEVFNDTKEPEFYTGLVDRIFEFRTWLDIRSPGIKTVICTVPDVGITPHLLQTYHDPTKRAGTRARIQAMNDDLKSRAAALENIEVADIHTLTLRIEDEDPFTINGTPFDTAPDDANPPDHLFCHDGFHPSTVLQALVANEIVAALNRLLGTAVAPFSNRELLDVVLGLDPDQPYLDWIATQGVALAEMHHNPDGDDFDNLAEFALGTAAAQFDPPLVPIRYQSNGQRLGLTWAPNPAATGYLEIDAASSTNLESWTPLAPPDLEDLGAGQWRAGIPIDGPCGYLRLSFKPVE